jgi:hypothetical protein
LAITIFKDRLVPCSFQIIKNSEAEIGNVALAEKTVFDKKKISNILHRLKKQGKIKSVDGFYKAA